MNTFRTLLALLGVSGLAAVIAAAYHPELRAGPVAQLREHEITIDAALARGAPVLWVDARPYEQFANDHIPGALSLDPADWEPRLTRLLERWQPGIRVVVYCDAAACDTSKEVAARLRDEVGLPDVFFLRGGWEAWKTQHP